ncbi:uncharacterized protein LOC121369224 isoform X2 [Gigantopelta aegis]|uniref:uncharacterized protein LOC121369224 isoform X2 n=1 Tax=Gigantopelta aegis TaxID=1735272 RepID=UPI001B8886D6|nr:uncharacterized protein LOC121369224 isoform X2 [Gigantopelta aegis]
MYNLFEVVRLLSVGKEQGLKQKQQVCVTKYAWKEEGEISLLALVCSNDSILLRYSLSGKPPHIKQLSWLPERVIVSMCFDPTVTWLLILTSKPELFIIPAFSLMEPKAMVNQIWKTDDATRIVMDKLKGDVTVIKWWHTLDDQQIAVIGSKSGELVFLDLIHRKVVTSTKVDMAICKLELVQDDQQMTTYLLITAVHGHQWNLFLESQTEMVTQLSHDQASGQLASEHLDIQGRPVKNILVTSEENKEMLVPARYQQFQRSVSLTAQYAKSRHFVTAHCDKSSTLQVYDSDLEHSPLFVYKLPVGVYNVILTDRLIFCTSRLSGKKLLVLSNQRAEISLANHQDFNKEAIVQQFDLPSEETILGVEKKNFPFYWHEKKDDYLFGCQRQECSSKDLTGSITDNVKSIPVKTHTVLDGCVFVTSHGVYECRPRVSPEHLFLDLAVGKFDPAYAESLGVSIGLDLTSLFELGADYLLRAGEVSRSIRLYHLSKCSHVKRVSNLAHHGHVQEVLSLLRQVLGNPQVELVTVERKQLADMALHCFVYQLGCDSGNTAGLRDSFRSFLLGNFSFDENTALNLLAEYGLIELLLEFATARGLVMETLDLLISQSQFNIPKSQLADLACRGFSAHLLKAGKGLLLQCLPADDLVSLLVCQPRMAIENVHLIESQLTQLSEDSLLALADIFDPSKPVMKSFLTRSHNSRNRTTSISSINSLTSYTSDADFCLMPTEVMMSKLVAFFVHVILLLNRQRDVGSDKLNVTDMLSDLDTELAKHRARKKSMDETKRKLALQPSLIGCQSSHAALIRDGDLYTWGNSRHGRLGHGDLVAEKSVCLPCRVETLHMLQIQVRSVACGRNHTVVITNQGVYGWGCSRYGQVGVGTTHSYSRPMLIETLASETCVSVDCGQYHTLVLTADSQLYSWGWGVHGQLGHSDPEDRLVPTLIKTLSGKNIVRIAAGYCHSLALTEQGDLYVFGCGYFGQLGLGNNLKQSTPVRLHTVDEPITAIGAKYFTSIVVTAGNHVYTWGCHPCGLRYSAQIVRRSRQHGQPLRDPIDSFLAPTLVDTIYVNGNITQVASGSLHCILLTTEGEVYTWGHNMDGQLGTGTKQEEKQPKMLTKINDRHIVMVKSGGEFNVAMDTNNQILVWGKNDMGQLGMQLPENSESSRQKLHSHRRHRIDPAQEALTPVVLRGIPVNDPNMQSLWQQASSESGDLELWLSEDSKDDCQLNMLPSLETVGNTKYCRKVIAVVTKVLSHLCSGTEILRLCVDHSDWLTAADINILLENNAQALCYHLHALSERRPSMQTEMFRHMTIQVVQHHIRLCVKKTETEREQTEELKTMVLEMLRHWDLCELPLTDLETVFTNNLQSLAYPIGLVLFRDRARSTKNVSQEDSETSTQLYVERFSTSFCLKVLHLVLSHFSKDDSKLTKEWNSWQLSSAPPSQDSGSRSRVEVQCREKLVPYDQVWRDIVRNLEKIADAQRCILLTRSEMDHLEEQAEQIKEEDTCDKSLAVLFTCGHHFTQQTFKNEVLVSLENELTDSPNKLPFTASLLKQYYSREGLLPLACPKCVLQAVATLS